MNIDTERNDEISVNDEKLLRANARRNFDIDREISTNGHPVYRHECMLMKVEDLERLHKTQLDRFKKAKELVEAYYKVAVKPFIVEAYD